MRTRSILILVGATTALSLTSCASAASPAPSPTLATSGSSTPSGTPSPTADPIVDRIELGDAGLTLLAGDRTVATAPDTDMSQTLATLTDALGAPVFEPGTPSDRGYCTIIPDVYTWSDSLWIADRVTPEDRYLDMRLFGDSVTRADGTAVALSTESGVSVGADGTTLRASVPGTDVYAVEYSEPQSYRVLLSDDEVEDEGFGSVGLVAFIRGEVVDAIHNHELLTALDDC